MNFEAISTRNPGTSSEETPKVEAPVAANKETEQPKKKGRPRGFAAMDRSKVSEIASKGGKAAHAAGTAHQFTSDEARVAGKKGGVAPHVRRGRGPRVTPAAPASDVEVTGPNSEQKSA